MPNTQLKEMCSFLAVNKRNEKLSFEMGVKFAASLYMGENFLV